MGVALHNRGVFIPWHGAKDTVAVAIVVTIADHLKWKRFDCRGTSRDCYADIYVFKFAFELIFFSNLYF